MSEPEQFLGAHAPAEAVESATRVPVPPAPATALAEEPATTGPSPSLRSRLPQGVILALGVGIGAAAVGACWLSFSLLGGDEGKKAGGSPSATATAERTQAPEPFGTDGTITLTEVGAGLEDGALCSGTGGYSDINLGTQVNISDAAGTLVASGSLGPGEKAETGCTFSFTVGDITPGSKFYTVAVGHRGGLTETEDELRAGGLEFTLGG
ncbi:hypothetical protein [Streptomyces sp. NPDC001380]|uniref:hypothetical protein n=1 Tax=Streptomyces sp. NPDC001380 TaxID=3364566 RepID=UPI00369DBDEC